MAQHPKIIVTIANINDALGVYYALKQNLVEIQDFDKIPKKQRKILENEGFLRKEVDIEYLQNLIEDRKTNIYVAKNDEGKIIGFASIHKDKFNIFNFRSTLDNLYVDDPEVEALLISEEKKFNYLEQISILPGHKRKGIGTALLVEIIANSKLPIVAFIVDAPLANIPSAHWHKYNGFELKATCDGEYKGKKFIWSIYIHFTK
ncbi:MAG: GNAT family N-acetyltransferase [Candidatus Thorarchaeota archaeon]